MHILHSEVLFNGPLECKKKKRLKIRRDMPSYPFAKHVKKIIAIMAPYTYIRKYAKYDHQFEKTKIKITSNNQGLDFKKRRICNKRRRERRRIRRLSYFYWTYVTNN